jgi:dTDP-4-amino-4,6-dideoxygalactose transaminase
MSEVQGAIGRVQLSKLDYIIKKQRENEKKIVAVISKFPEFIMRISPENSAGTADAVVFYASPVLSVSEIRKSLLSVNISTKILPEATSWHFARNWTHLFDHDEITGIAIQESFNNSFKLLSSSISIPNGVYLRENFLIDLDTALSRVTKKI